MTEVIFSKYKHINIQLLVYSFLQSSNRATINHIKRVNAQYLGLFISTGDQKCVEVTKECVNAQYLGLFISTLLTSDEYTNRKEVLMPSISGYSFLQTGRC